MITTHVLDLARGVPGAGIAVTLEMREAAAWSRIATGTTDHDGRLATLTAGRALAAGTYRLTFDLATYHREHGIADPFFPDAQIAFNIRNAAEHFHVPLLLSPFGYSTYRGS
jgi:5-hydroxyisourate hydrolase